MNQCAAPRTIPTTLGRIAVGIAVGIAAAAAIIGSLTHQPAGREAPPVWAATSGSAPSLVDDGGLTEVDGALRAGVTVFDDEYPGVSRLDGGLRHALRKATEDAARDGTELSITSGWRSRAYQDRLLREAVSRYGSTTEAARWVATPATSPHVSGEAVDIASGNATAWLAAHGAHYGLCPVYRNEPWHYELRPRAVDRGCPRLYPDAAHDPRMR